jgi:hypothetical protein
MDSARACMWLELIVAPLAAAEPIVVVWDNCGSHKTDGVLKFAKSLAGGRVHLVNLLENTTDLLQVMDLVVNAPIKADIRHFRIQRATSQFAAYQQRYQQRKAELGASFSLADVETFAPPKIPLCSGIDCVLTTLGSGHLTTAVRDTFVKTGLCKEPATNAYRKLTLKDLKEDMGTITGPLAESWKGADLLLGKEARVRPVAMPDNVDDDNAVDADADDSADDCGLEGDE